MCDRTIGMDCASTPERPQSDCRVVKFAVETRGRLSFCNECVRDDGKPRSRALDGVTNKHRALSPPASPIPVPTFRPIQPGPLMHKARSLRSLAISTNINRQHDGPPSPTFSEVTNASAMNFGENGPAKIVTRADLKASMQAYDNVSPRPPLLCTRLRSGAPPALAHPPALITAPQLLRELPIRAAQHVQGHGHVRGRHGGLREVRDCTVDDHGLISLRAHSAPLSLSLLA